MLAVNYSTMRNKLKDFCDAASDRHETVVVTRKNEKNYGLMELGMNTFTGRVKTKRH